MKYKEIIENLPYEKPFLFVDELMHVDENGVEGVYVFSDDSDFYKGHFKDNPVTPGVILTECCAQIGVVSLGLFLLQDALKEGLAVGMSSSEMEFYIPVLPREKVRVISKKIYYRFHKLKCEVKMYNSLDKLVCKGVISGMLKSSSL